MPWRGDGIKIIIIIIIIIIITVLIIGKSETFSEAGARRGRKCPEKSIDTIGNKQDLFHEMKCRTLAWKQNVELQLQSFVYVHIKPEFK